MRVYSVRFLKVFFQNFFHMCIHAFFDLCAYNNNSNSNSNSNNNNNTGVCRTDRRTERLTRDVSIYRACIASRGKIIWRSSLQKGSGPFCDSERPMAGFRATLYFFAMRT